MKIFDYVLASFVCKIFFVLPPAVPGKHVLAAILMLTAAKLTGEHFLSDADSQDVEALKFGIRLNKLCQYVRALKRKNKHARSHRIGILKGLIKLKEYNWTEKRKDHAEKMKAAKNINFEICIRFAGHGLDQVKHSGKDSKDHSTPIANEEQSPLPALADAQHPSLPTEECLDQTAT